MKKNYWSEYWKQGFSTTFGDSSEYHGLILEHWQKTFKKTLDGSTILDVACGNGALSKIAMDIAVLQNKRFEIYANDSAEIGHSHSNLSERGVKFYPNTPTESLPFSESLFSLIVSQYGFEYSELQTSLAEIDRVASLGAKVSFICHSKNSIILRDAIKLKYFLYDLLSKAELFLTLEKLVVSMGELRSTADLGQLVGNRLTDTLRDDFNKLLAEYMHSHGDALTHSDIPLLINELFESKLFYSVEEKLKIIHRYKHEFVSHLKRLEELENASLSSVDVEEIEKFESTKLGVFESFPFTDESGALLGVLIQNYGEKNE